MELNKKQVVNVLETIAVYLEIKGENPFKISAYRRAAQALETDNRSMASIDDPAGIKGIGKGTAQVIRELMETGTSTILEELQKDIPAGLLDLLKIPGLGGKKISKLYQSLHVVDFPSLKKACEEGKVHALEGFGLKTEEKLLKALEARTVRPERLPIAYMLKLAEAIESVLRDLPSAKRFSRAGSLRRAKEMMKDLDFVIATDDAAMTADEILQRLPIYEQVGKGEAKMTVLLADDYHVSVDFRFAEPEAFITTLNHFTGSKEHNVLMRHLAKTRHEKISEYGVDDEDEDEWKRLTFATEKEFYAHFGLHWIPPEVREGGVEVDKAKEGELGLITLADIKGDLHMHTTWSDGAYTVQEMADAMREKGYQYACVTDHSKSLRVAGGLSAYRLLKQREEIERVNQLYDDFKLFAGVEMDILPDGRLDYDDDVLKELDFVIASIHSSFSQDRSTIMKRFEAACMNPYVRLIAHPTGRLLGRRKGYPVDVEQLIELARVSGTALELNANRNRLDLSPKWLAKAQAAGVKMAINTDSHSIKMIGEMTLGVQTAVRGWIRPQTVLNTLSLEALSTFLKQKKSV